MLRIRYEREEIATRDFRATREYLEIDTDERGYPHQSGQMASSRTATPKTSMRSPETRRSGTSPRKRRTHRGRHRAPHRPP